MLKQQTYLLKLLSGGDPGRHQEVLRRQDQVGREEQAQHRHPQVLQVKYE